jgi:hypothetical protein
MSDKRKFILSDADGVLLDWRHGFLKWLPEEISSTACPEEMKNYYFNNAFDWSREHIDNLAEEFNMSPAIERLQPYRDSVKFVRMLGEAGFTFHVCSAMGGNELSRKLRIRNLKAVFGDYFGIVDTLPEGSSKAAWLDQFTGSDYFWIEDHVGHAQDGYDLGLKSILVGDVTNSHHNDLPFPRVSENKPWEEIYSIIINDYNS